jgi:hypothetical protein
MPWVSPIFDRELSDIQNRTNKGFFNVSDWNRINGNISEVKDLILSILGLTVTITTLIVPDTNVHPAAEDINSLVGNIEFVRIGACLPLTVGLEILKHDYEPGNGAATPNYIAVNSWEKNLNLLYVLLPNVGNYKVYCGVATVGQPRFYQNRWR